MAFDTFLMVDWSGGNDRGLRPTKDAIWTCVARRGKPEPPRYHRNRQVAEAWLTDLFEVELTAGRKVCAGFDFPFGYPVGFGRAVAGSDDPLALWDWLAERVADAPKSNNRFDVAGQINALFPGLGPFWGNGLARDIAHLPRKGNDRTFRWSPERRRAEAHPRAKGAFTCWQMSGAGAVGGQVIMGLPVLSRLRRAFPGQIAVWPFEPLTSAIALVEIWPSLTVTEFPADTIRDAWQVQKVATDLSCLPVADLAGLLNVPTTSEGWILGLDPR